MVDNSRQWDRFTDALTYAYSTQVHRTSMIDPLNLVLSRQPRHLELEVETKIKDRNAKKDFQIIWLSRLRIIMGIERKEMNETQARDEANFDVRVKGPKVNVNVGFEVFIRKYNHPIEEPSHKLEPIVTGQ